VVRFLRALFRYGQMIKNLFLLIIVLLNGCILYVETDPSTTTYSSVLSLDYAQVECDYNLYWGDSVWYFDAEITVPYSYYDDEVWAGVYIDGWDYYPLASMGYGMWTAGLETYYYDCNDGNVFDFVVSDVYGNYDEVTVWW